MSQQSLKDKTVKGTMWRAANASIGHRCDQKYLSAEYQVFQENLGCFKRVKYDDRIEFHDLGHFPIGNTYQDFIDAPHSSPVNPVIVDVFYRSGLMEALGRGITSIFAECESAGMPVTTQSGWHDK